ncbi:hypothetical protein OHA21_03330 [Actinoplanes sp. NBC_00393]|uniref:hypothetical protein n=1 Tax=Actinoplanes sp. NBC_00393 TaxID=2975953 RepID=UPI002E230D71
MTYSFANRRRQLALAIAATLVILMAPAPAALAAGAGSSRSGSPVAHSQTADATPDDKEANSEAPPVTWLLVLGGAALAVLVGAAVWSVRRRPSAS